MALQPHQKIINDVARNRLKPAGLIQRGKSRLWLDDHGWWTTVVEFQPSPKSKGSFLNVGVCFHWYAKNYWSFDIDYRDQGFVDYVDEPQFVGAMDRLNTRALEKVNEYRQHFQTRESAAHFIIKACAPNVKTLWPALHTANAYFLLQDYSGTRKYCELLLKEKPAYEWIAALQSFVRTLLTALDNGPHQYEDALKSTIRESRSLKELPECEIRF